METSLETLKRQRTILLTSYRKDGTPVGTPVNVVVGDGRAYFRTYDKAFKTRRLARNPEVEIAPSTFRGKVTGPAVRGRARLLTEEESKPVRRLLARKHPLLQGILVPLIHRVLRHRTLHYGVILDGCPHSAGTAPRRGRAGPGAG